MSSTSPSAPGDVEVIVVGTPWSAAVVVDALVARGARVAAVWDTERTEPVPRETVLHIGNGECWENARLMMGDSLAGALWELSRRSRERAKELCGRVGVEIRSGELLWAASSEKHKALLYASISGTQGAGWTSRVTFGKHSFAGALREPALGIDLEDLRRAVEVGLRKAGVDIATAGGAISVEKEKGLSYRVSFTEGDMPQVRRGSIVVVVSDALPPRLFPSLRETWIPVTLSALSQAGKSALPWLGALFNGGADFAVFGGKAAWFGSYRNLYEDKAVGLVNAPDPAMVRGVTGFFGDLGWLGKGEAPRAAMGSASLSCDGLPLVGSLAEAPGVHVVGAFAARTQNFIFEVAALLAGGILKGQRVGELERFSTKRFL